MSAPRNMTALESGTHQGIEWAIVRAPLYGAINGYVRVPAGHPWHGLDYDAVPVQVHGGLTYGGGESGWIGFDTLHSGDIWPGVPDWMNDTTFSWARRWTQADVIAETKALAEAVAIAATTEEPALSSWRKATRHAD